MVRHAGAWAGVEDVEVWGGTWPRWRLALGDAALAGLLVYGPPEGNRVTYVRPEDWLGPQPAVDPETALAEVFRRYLRAYGPATARDFAQWFYLPPADARALAARLAAEVEPVDVAGHRALLLRDAGAPAPPLPVDGAPRLLPHFDSYVIGCFPRDQLVTDAWRARVPPRTTPSQFPELLIAGRVAGLWERQGRGAAITVGVEPVVPLAAGAEAALAAEAARIGTILEAESTTLAIGPVAARPHL